MGVQIQGAGRAAPGHVSRADSSKPLIHDSIHGQKYIQKAFLGKVGARSRPEPINLPRAPRFLRWEKAPVC